MKAVILAGGKGTRLGLTDIPKPMVSVSNKPLLLHQIELLKRYGITDITLLLGHLGAKIEEYFGDGTKYGVKISYLTEDKPLGTAGAIKELDGIIEERFLVLYGDVMMDFDINSFIEFDKRSSAIASIIVHPNDHPYDSDLVEVDPDNNVTRFLSKPHEEGMMYNNNVNAAVYIFGSDIFQYIERYKSSDFGKDIFPLIMKEGLHKIKAYSTPEYIKDLGTPDRLENVEAAYLSGKIAAYNKANKRTAIFIDRDGVINKEVDNLKNIADFVLLPNVAEAIKKVNDSDFLAIVITNQPVIAKGFILEKDLLDIHKKLETEIGRQNAFIDKLYYCPHHPDKGYVGEVKELKIECSCRKPNTGMLDLAVKEFNIDLSRSYFIGDSTTDIQTGINAGVKTVLVKTGYAGKDNKYNVKPDYSANNLDDAVDLILKINDNK
ncbi:D,D-heptose 1,7-bisphosphate phosphatase [Pedobacter sp. HMWF019]|uniref:HAD-IIIA family hydrolase n=1 Tax=Pedobacter sp. HMWF019 TaxID=2056856 RepID=UPI000D3957B6|nr:HAD-IIIA family hydrolase [Pedobacter sp. HMWF019]PTS93926.1 D,D-heptose 1,7-bisphosphate phosphatase [Pedobacter sp. HMWF019]